jgi:uncharacterized protein YjbJ (UPF0337 family)
MPRSLAAVCRSNPYTGDARKRKGSQMNWDRIEGNWKQVKGNIKEKWGELTDDEFDQIAGKRDRLVGKIQERYGISRDEADKQVRTWEETYRDDMPRH